MTLDLTPWRKGKKAAKLTRVSREENPMLALHREINDLFDEFFRDFEDSFGWPAALADRRGTARLVPQVDVSETEKDILVKADLPGLEEKDVEVTLDDNLLTIRGEKRHEHEEKDRDYYLMERSYGSFERAIPLPEGIEQDKIAASFKNGVLTVTIPKTPEARSKTKRIPIKAG